MNVMTTPTSPAPFPFVIPADYIRVLAEWLRLPVTTTSTSLLYFYRFDKYRKDAYNQRLYPELKYLDTLLFATCCVYLATKTTDCSRKIRDVLNCAHRALHPDQDQLRLDTTFSRLRDSVLSTELALLRILKFELEIELAYWPTIQYVRYLFRINPSSSTATPLKEQSTNIPVDVVAMFDEPDVAYVPPAARAVLQIAWMLVSDSYLRSSVLLYAAKDIALAAVFITLHQIQPGQAPLLHELCDKFGLVTECVERVVIWMVSTHLPERKPRSSQTPTQRTSAPSTPSSSIDSSRSALDFFF